MSDHGLLTTVAYKLGRDTPACYALEVMLLNVDIVYYIMFLADYFLPKQCTCFVYLAAITFHSQKHEKPINFS